MSIFLLNLQRQDVTMEMDSNHGIQLLSNFYPLRFGKMICDDFLCFIGWASFQERSDCLSGFEVNFGGSAVCNDNSPANASASARSDDS